MNQVALREALQAEPDQLDDTMSLYRPCGVFRVTHEPKGSPHAGMVLTRASELSVRYPIVPIDFTRRQAS